MNEAYLSLRFEEGGILFWLKIIKHLPAAILHAKCSNVGSKTIEILQDFPWSFAVCEMSDIVCACRSFLPFFEIGEGEMNEILEVFLPDQNHYRYHKELIDWLKMCINLMAENEIFIKRTAAV